MKNTENSYLSPQKYENYGKICFAPEKYEKLQKMRVCPQVIQTPEVLLKGVWDINRISKLLQGSLISA